MSKPKPTAGVTVRHARSCGSRRGSRCDCAPTFQARAYDASAGKRLSRTFKTASAARIWKRDAEVALRRGEVSAERGLTLADAAEQWLQGLRDGRVFNRSGDPYKPSAIRGYEHALARRVLP